MALDGPMKVKDLIEQLQKCDPEAIVLTAKDDEGNGFNEVYYNITPSLYIDDGGDIEVCPVGRKGIAWHFGYDDDDPEVDELLNKATPCIVI